MQDAAARIAERFGALFAERAVLARDRSIASALATESRPVAEALLEGVSGAARVDARAGELRETLALASLLGRRAAVLGATPSGALEIAPVLLEAARDDAPRALDLLDALRAVCIEGYFAAFEEGLEERGARRAADAIAVVDVVPGCIAVFAAGLQEPDELARVLDDLGRRMLERGSRACIVDATLLREPHPERARHLFAVRATCEMLGVVCIFVGVDGAWRRAAAEAGIDLAEARIEADFPSALRSGLDVCGFELRTKAGIGEVFRRIVARRDR